MKRMKRIAAMVLAVAMLMSCLAINAFAALTVKGNMNWDITNEDKIFTIGTDEFVELAIENTDQTGMTGMIFIVYCDTDVFTLYDFELGRKYGGMGSGTSSAVLPAESEKDGYRIVWYTGSKTDITDKDMGTLLFEVNPDAINGEYDFEVECVEVGNIAEDKFAVSFSAKQTLEIKGGINADDYKPTKPVVTGETNFVYDKAVTTARLTASSTVAASDAALTYKWYNSADKEVSTGAEFTPALPAVGSSATYYCVVTATSAIGEFTAKSDSVTISHVAADPTLDLLDYNLPTSGTYTGNPFTATVAPKGNVEGLGTITVEYNGSAEAPVNAGTYTVTVEITKGANYTAKTLTLGSFTISKVVVDVPAAADHEYNGSKQTGVADGAYYSLSGDYEATNVGTYTVTAKLDDTANYEWKLNGGNSSADQTLEWHIFAQEVPVPTLNFTTTVYNKSEQTAMTAASELYTVKDGSATNAGSYTAVASLIDKDNYVWAGKNGSSADLTFNWTIEKASVDLPTAATGLVYTGSEQTGVASLDDALYTVTDGKATDAGNHTAKASLKDKANYQWKGKNTSDDQNIAWSIARAKIAKPTAATGLKYTGSEQTAVVSGTGYTLSGTYKATNAGSYSATAKLDKNHQWNDGTTTDVALNWSIAKADPTITAGDATIVLGYSANLNAAIAGVVDGDLDDAELTYAIDPSTGKVTVDKNGKVTVAADAAEGEYTVTISYAGNTNYNAAEKEVTVTVTAKLPVNVTLTDKEKTDAIYGTEYSVSDFVGAANTADTCVPAGEYTYTVTYPDGSSAAYTAEEFAELTVTEAGTYTVTVKYECDTHVGSAAVTFTIARATVEKPSAVSGLIYNGKEQTGVAAVEGKYTVTDGKATDAGDYTAVAKLNSNYMWAGETGEAATADYEVEWSIAKAEIVVSGYEWDYTKPFTYNKEAHTVALKNVDSKLTVSYTDNTKTAAGSYTAKAAVTVKTEYADNYMVKGTVADCPWTIDPKTVDVSGVTFVQDDIPYDGAEHTVAVTGLPAEGVKVTYTGDITKINAGNYTATATLEAVDSNYELSGTAVLTLNWKITKAELADIVIDREYKYTQSGDQVLTFTLPADAGTVSFGEIVKTDANGVVSKIEVVNGKVTITLSGTASAEDTAKYVIPVTMTNYEDITITVNVSLLNRETPTVTVESIEVTYSGKPITSAAIVGTASVPGTWEFVTDVSGMINAGEYTITVKFVPNNTTDYAEVVVSDVKLTVKQATPVVGVSYKLVTSGGTLADAELAIADSSVPGTVEWKLPLDTEVEMNKAYEWVFTPDDQTNYTTVEGSAILFRMEGSGIPSNPIPPVSGGGDAIAPWVNPYTDITEGTWYYSAVEFVTVKGLMNGVGGGKFAPGGTVTRGTLMTILARRAGVNTDGGATWYEKGMAWAVAEGISDGTNPTANITREQIVTMLWRAVGSPNFDHISIEGFVDDENVSDWALDAVKWAVGAGLLNGREGNRLDPTGTAVRAELATILNRFCKTYG